MLNENKEKQMEFEMSEILDIIAKARKIYANDVTDHTENEYIREYLLDAGYRKQVEGEWRLEEGQIGLFGTDQYFVCSACNEEFFVDGWDYEDLVAFAKFCPNCGAKMKGGE